MLDKKYGVLFVCLGNICRSPLGEGVFRALVQERGLDQYFIVDSCGTGSWHVGEAPHQESQYVAKKHGVSLAGQKARQVRDDDFLKFDLILAMDESVKSDLEDIRIGQSATIKLLREFDPAVGRSLDVPDPYYGGPDGFEEVYQIIYRSCVALLNILEEKLKIKAKD